MGSSGDWCLIESDPGVFTELIRGFGVSGVQVEDLYSLDFSQLDDFKPIHGLIFLFKYRPGEETSGVLDYAAKDVYFAQQVINNACATQAIINLLLNLDENEVSLGPILDNFRSFSKELDPASRGLCLSNSQEIRTVHNSFSRQNCMEIEGPKLGKDDSYHFVTYVPVAGRVYELDGLKEAPVDVGEIPEDGDWLTVLSTVLSARVNSHTSGEIMFNLMAVVGDRKQKLEEQLKALKESGMETDEAASKIYGIQMAIAAEEEKLERYHNENARRRHNYTPFIVELLKILAREGKLVDLMKRAEREKKSKR